MEGEGETKSTLVFLPHASPSFPLLPFPLFSSPLLPVFGDRLCYGVWGLSKGQELRGGKCDRKRGVLSEKGRETKTESRMRWKQQFLRLKKTLSSCFAKGYHIPKNKHIFAAYDVIPYV